MTLKLYFILFMIGAELAEIVDFCTNFHTFVRCFTLFWFLEVKLSF